MSIYGEPVGFERGATLPVLGTDMNNTSEQGRIIEVSLQGKTVSIPVNGTGNNNNMTTAVNAATPFTNIVFVRPSDFVVKSEAETCANVTNGENKSVPEIVATTNVKASHNGHIYLVSPNGNLKPAGHILNNSKKSIKQETSCPDPTTMPGTSIQYRTPGASFVNRNGKVKRPMNAFMLWARVYRGKLAADMPNASNAEISVRLGQVWSSLPANEKQIYYVEAERIKNKHRQDFPGWVYQPRQNKRIQPTPNDQHNRLWQRYTTQYVKTGATENTDDAEFERKETTPSPSYIKIAPASVPTNLNNSKIPCTTSVLSPIPENVTTIARNDSAQLSYFQSINLQQLHVIKSEEKPTIMYNTVSETNLTDNKEELKPSQNLQSLTECPMQARRGRPPTVTSRIDNFISRSSEADIIEKNHSSLNTKSTSAEEPSKKTQNDKTDETPVQNTAKETQSSNMDEILTQNSAKKTQISKTDAKPTPKTAATKKSAKKPQGSKAVENAAKTPGKKSQSSKVDEPPAQKTAKIAKIDDNVSDIKQTKKSFGTKKGKQNNKKQKQADDKKTSEVLWPFPIPQTEKTTTEQIIFAEETNESKSLHLELSDPYDPFYFERHFDQRTRSPKELQLDVTSWQQYLNNEHNSSEDSRQKLDNYFAVPVSCPSDIEISPIPVASTIKRENKDVTISDSTSGLDIVVQQRPSPLQTVISNVTSQSLEEGRTTGLSSSDSEIGNAITQAVSVLQSNSSEVCNPDVSDYTSTSTTEVCHAVTEDGPFSTPNGIHVAHLLSASSTANLKTQVSGTVPHKMIDKRPFKKRAYTIMHDVMGSDQEISNCANLISNGTPIAKDTLSSRNDIQSDNVPNSANGQMNDNWIEQSKKMKDFDMSDDETEPGENALYIDLTNHDRENCEQSSMEVDDDDNVACDEKTRLESSAGEVHPGQVKPDVTNVNTATSSDVTKSKEEVAAADKPCITCDSGDASSLGIQTDMTSEDDISDCKRQKSTPKRRKRSRRVR